MIILRHKPNNLLKIWAESTWEPLLDEALRKAMAQRGTDSLPASVREAGFSAIDRAASTVLDAFPADQVVEGSIGELPEMTSLLKLLKLDRKIEGMGLDLSGVTGSHFN